MREKIITALDFEYLSEATHMVELLDKAVFFKVGLQSFIKFGRELLYLLREKNKKVFLDLKFKDIPNTVAGAIESTLTYDPEMLTIHLSGGAAMIRSAVEAAREKPGLRILGVTILTSLSDQDLQDTGLNLPTRDAVLKLCELGLNNGLNSFVCSPHEIEPIKSRFGKDVVLVTPGIRPDWSAKGDQKRVFTPKMAIDTGSDYLVVGRPITQNSDPAAAFEKIVTEIE